MPIISKDAQKALDRAKQKKTRADDGRTAEKLAAANARAKLRADRHNAELVLGKAILAVNDAGDISPEELAIIGRVAHRWKKPTADFYLISDLKPPEAPARPAIMPDPLADAAE